MPESSKFRRLLDGLIRYNFLVDLESIQHKLSSDYSLNIYVSRAIWMVHNSLRTIPYKMPIFERSVTCSFFQELYLHIDKNSVGKV